MAGTSRSDRCVFTLPFVLTLVAIAALSTLKLWQNVQVARLPAEQKAAYQNAHQATLTMLDDFARRERGRMTKAELAEMFPQYRIVTRPPFTAQTTDGKSYVREEGYVEDPRAGTTISIYFIDGRVSGYGTRPAVPKGLGPPAYWELGQQIRQRTMYAAMTLWIVGMAMTPIVWQHAGPARWARALLLLAVAWAAAGMLTADAFRSMSHFVMRMEYWAWALAAVVASSVLLWAAVRRPRDWTKCAACGYDLTGNVSGVCPECGQPVPVQVAALPRKAVAE